MRVGQSLRRVFCTLAFLALSHVNSAAQGEPQATGTATNAGRFIGLHIHRPIQAPWPNFDFAGWRLLDAGVSWRSVQPTRSQFDFNRLDVWTRVAEVKGVDLTYVFYATPAWASARPDEPGANGAGSAAEPKSMDDWRTFVRAVVTRYKGRIKYYEVWNEPNWKNFYTGTWPQLATLVHETARIIKEVDPAAKLVLPGLASEHGLTVIDEFLQTGVGQDVDIVGYHFYTGHRPPEVLFNMIGKLRNSLIKAGLDKKPLWNTEFGWLIEGHGRKIVPGVAGFSDKAPVYSDEVAASFLMRAFIIMASSGVQRSYFYAWDNESMGIYDQNAKVLKPTLAKAFPALARWLKDGVLPCSRESNLYTCALPGANSSASLIWTDQGLLDPDKLAQDWRSFEDIQGIVHPLTVGHNTLAMGPGPYLLRR